MQRGIKRLHRIAAMVNYLHVVASGFAQAYNEEDRKLSYCFSLLIPFRRHRKKPVSESVSKDIPIRLV
jgi:hypothetical protein